jgi:hypothetical protein
MPSLNEFKSSFTTDLAKANRFDVSIPVPLVLIPYRGVARTLSLRCESTTLPSRTFSTLEQKFGSNPVEKYPYMSNYNDIEMTFIVSGDMEEKKFFDAWMEYINPTYKNDFRYKTDYISTLKINQYDERNNLTYSVNLIDAYPIAVNQLDLNWSSTEYHKLTVVFANSYWQNNSLQSFGSSLAQNFIAQVATGFSPKAYTGLLGSQIGIETDIVNADGTPKARQPDEFGNMW